MVKRAFSKLMKAAGLYERAKILRNLGRKHQNLDSRTFSHRQKLLKFYSQFIRTGDLCFDIGANLGNRVEIFLLLGAIVVAVEPQQECMRELRVQYHGNNRVVLIEKGLDEKPGERELQVCSANTLSSFSGEWIQRVKESGRFSEFRWKKKRKIQTTTLDRLIEEYGAPAFCKIDVEGHEYPILRGYSSLKIPALSFEYTPEFIQSALQCVRHLESLGYTRFNYSPGESMEMALPAWISGRNIRKALEALSPATPHAGDVYVSEMKE